VNGWGSLIKLSSLSVPPSFACLRCGHRHVGKCDDEGGENGPCFCPAWVPCPAGTYNFMEGKVKHPHSLEVGAA
jgi:hypothetical protein